MGLGPSLRRLGAAAVNPTQRSRTDRHERSWLWVDGGDAGAQPGNRAAHLRSPSALWEAARRTLEDFGHNHRTLRAGAVIVLTIGKLSATRWWRCRGRSTQVARSHDLVMSHPRFRLREEKHVYSS